jgi:hypothetical protein
MLVGSTIHCEIHKLITSIKNKEKCLNSGQSQLLYLFIGRAVQLIVVIIQVHHFCFVNETNSVHFLLLVYFVNFIYILYMFWTSPCPSSAGTAVLMWHLILVILYNWMSGMQDTGPGRSTSGKQTQYPSVGPRGGEQLFEKQKNPVSVRIQTSNHPSRSLISIQTEHRCRDKWYLWLESRAC